MSRWGRGRAGSVTVPLEHLFRENSNCPSAARSQGTVGKWGVTSFTSIRSHPYGFGGINAFQKKPKQDQNRPLTVPAVEPSNVVPPKPKKFFKSRNVVSSENAALPTSSVAPPEADEAFPSFSKKEEKQTKPQGYGKKSKAEDSDKLEIPKLKIHVERSPKSNKSKFFATKASKKEEPAYEEKTHLSPNKRYLVRNRDKVINYSEDRGDSPPPAPEIIAPPETSVLKVGTPKTSPAATILVKPGLMSPTNKDGKPPIVLRISKGTSRLLSTDSEDILTSPTSDRHSFSEPISEPSETIVREPSPPPPPPKQESLKITIKCYAANKEKNKKAAVEDGDARVTRASKRNQHKEDAPSSSSPIPGTDNYELYRTLASPPKKTPPHVAQSEAPKVEAPQMDDVEMSLAILESGETSEPTPPAPTQTAAENQGGRAMRHRQNINYNENAINVIDEITSSKLTKNPAKSYSRKSKKKNDVEAAPVEAIPPSESPPRVEAPTKEERFADASESEPPKVKNNKKQKSTFEFDDVPAELEGETKCKSVEKHEFKSPKRLSDSAATGETEDKPSVKLVITKKKGSIFKSRSLVNDGPGATGKKRHLYKHKWADDGKGGQTPRPEPETSAQATLQDFEEDQALTRITHYQKDKHPVSEEFENETYTSVKCPKNAKEYYTVVRNVKKAHQIQEIGEFQEFNDDVEYILDALQDNNPMSTRCLSAITLASKCTAPAFRMHVRAHGTVAKFFRALHDATNDQSLGLCTATVMFVLSQDRLNMDLDRESLELMLNLLESDVSHKNALDDCGLTSVQLSKNKERVRELCAEIKSQEKAKHLDLDNITVGHLAMETLLSLTSKRAGEWFTEELRTLGGVDHILSTICDCCTRIGDYVAEWTPDLLDMLRKIDRCMRVLENVTELNEDNQLYLVNWKSGQAVDTLVRLFRLCDREIPLYPTGGSGAAAGTAGGAGATIRDALLPTLKVLVNLTHSYRPTSTLGSQVVGQQKGVIDASLHLLLQAPNYLPDANNFEFSVCVLLLLMNLMQNNSNNVKQLFEAQAPADFEAVFKNNKPAMQALIDHFYKREGLAKMEEQNTDAILEGQKAKDDAIERKNKSHDEFIEETVAKLLKKAGVHMEHTMVGSYLVLLIGHIVMDSPENEARVRKMLPSGNFEVMITVLRKYYSFLSLTASAEATSVAHVKATDKIINYLDNCDKRQNIENSGAGTSSHSNVDATNSSNVSAADFTSDSDKMSSSMELDSSFN